MNEYAYAQPVGEPANPAVMFMFVVLAIAAYIYSAYTLMLSARKLGVGKDWMAWVPIVNIYLMIKMAGKPWWWLLLLFIPFVNFIVLIMLWMNLVKRFGQSEWLGILAIFSPVGLIFLGFMAWKWQPSTISASVSPAPAQIPPATM